MAIIETCPKCGHEAARQLGKASVHGEQNILICARGITKTAYGYIWKFADEVDNTKLTEELK